MKPKQVNRRVIVPTLVAGALGLAGLCVMPSASAAPAAGGQWSTSFEEGDPEISVSQIGDLNNTRGRSLPGAFNSYIERIDGDSQFSEKEGYAKLFDLDYGTKWLSKKGSNTWAQIELREPKALSHYQVTSANDAPERDPKDFRLQGSSDGQEWVDIDIQTGQEWSGRHQTKDYVLDEPSAEYRYWRFYVDAAQDPSKNLMQVAELELFSPSDGVSPEPLEIVVGTGPGTAINAKENVGFTGMHSLKYAGGHLEAGAADYEAYLAQGIDVVVGEDTELNYLIFPELDANLDYAATYGAIDLEFSDGSRMSEDPALRDIYGYHPDSQSWGDSNLLIAAEWNSVHVDLGSRPELVGKTVKSVIFTYHNAQRGSESTAFQGWIDDIRIGDADRLDRDSVEGPVSFVDTRRGTNADGGFSRGLNLPGALLPNGFNFYAPATKGDTESAFYKWHRNNDANNRPALQALLISHQPSNWMGDRMQLAIMPSLNKEQNGGLSSRQLAFSHDNEIARPDFYQVEFDNGLVASMAPEDHSVIYRFDLSQNNGSGSVIVDQAGASNTAGGGAKLAVDQASGVVSGWVDHGSGYPGKSRMFVYGKFDAPVSSVAAAGGRGKAIRASFDSVDGGVVELRLATSFISLDQAESNLRQEMGENLDRSFEDVKAKATNAWNERLEVIDVSASGANDQQLVTIYSNLYRLNMYPNSQHEYTGSGSAPGWEGYQHASPVLAKTGDSSDTQTNAAVVDGPMYVNNGFWDTYRSAWPLYGLLYGEDVVEPLVDGFAQQYREGGWIARWSSPGYADLMTGTSSDVAFAEVFQNGKITDVDLALDLFDSGLKNATVVPTSTDAYNSSWVGRKALAQSAFLGYTPQSLGQSVSWGMEGYVNDYGLYLMADKLIEQLDGQAQYQERVERLKSERDYLQHRSENYGNLFNKDIVLKDDWNGSPLKGGFGPRDASGKFGTINPTDWGGAYTEGNGWTFFYHAMFDAEGMAALYDRANGGSGEGGSNQAILDSLEAYFATPDHHALNNSQGIHEAREAREVRMGQWGISNQIAYHVPWVAAGVGDPTLTQKYVREALQRIFQGYDIGQGYLGDEDNGAFSSWYIFSMLGLYPLEMGSGNYVLGSPMLDEVSVELGNGKTLTVKAPGAESGQVYVGGVTFNGTALDVPKIDGDLLRGGGTLEFTMSDDPTNWGKFQPTSKVPAPSVNLLDKSYATISGEGSGVLTDRNAATSVKFDSGEAVISLDSKVGPMRVDSYTITNARGKSPSAWTLEGSNDGQNWETLDQVSGFEFRWETQVAPMTVASPGQYRHYRLNLTGASGMELSQIELLGKASGAESDFAFTAADPAQLRLGETYTGEVGTFLGGEGTRSSDYQATVKLLPDGEALNASVEPTSAGVWRVSIADIKPEILGLNDFEVSVTDISGQSPLSDTGIFQIETFTDDTFTGRMNNACITDKGQALADCDGQGWQLDRSELAAGGFTQGEVLEHNGLLYPIPEVAPGDMDNVTDEGATFVLNVPAEATTLALLGTSNEGAQTGTVTITYSDGSQQQASVKFADWVHFGNKPAGTVASVPGRYSGTSTDHDNKGTGIYASEPIQLLSSVDAGEEVRPVSLTMPVSPNETLKKGRMHIFAIGTDADPLDAKSVVLEPEAEISDELADGEAQIDSPLATVLDYGHATGDEDLEVTLNWGDGSGAQPGTVSEATISGSHLYTAAGKYPVTVTVSDGVQSTSTVVDVLISEPEPPLTYQPVVALNPEQPTAGESFVVTGTGFAPGEEVTVTIDGDTIPATADAEGNWSLTLPGMEEGVYTLEALGAQSQAAVSVTVQVVPGDEGNGEGGEDLEEIATLSVAFSVKPIAGQEVRAVVDTGEIEADLSHQWLIDGEPVGSARSSLAQGEKIILGEDTAGSTLTLVVTATADGFKETTKSVAEVIVAPEEGSGGNGSGEAGNGAGSSSGSGSEMAQTGAPIAILALVAALALVGGVVLRRKS